MSCFAWAKWKVCLFQELRVLGRFCLREANSAAHLLATQNIFLFRHKLKIYIFFYFFFFIILLLSVINFTGLIHIQLFRNSVVCYWFAWMNRPPPTWGSPQHLLRPRSLYCTVQYITFQYCIVQYSTVLFNQRDKLDSSNLRVVCGLLATGCLQLPESHQTTCRTIFRCISTFNWSQH